MLRNEKTSWISVFRGSFLALLALGPAGCFSNPASPLADAARKGDRDLVASLLAQGENPDGRDGLGRTALMNASGAPERTLNIDAHGRSTFSDEPGHADLPTLRLLIERGATLDLVDDAGHTALYFAVRAGSTEAVSTLLAAGAGPDVGRGLSPILIAANQDDLECVKLLVAAGADLAATDQHGQTSLIAAAYGGNVPILRELLSAGAVIDATDEAGNTALSNAAYQGQLEATRFLIDSGATLDLRSNQGSSALSVAVQRGHAEVAALLRAAGAHE